MLLTVLIAATSCSGLGSSGIGESDLPCVDVEPYPISVDRVESALRAKGIRTFQAGCFVDEGGAVELIGRPSSVTCLVYGSPQARGEQSRRRPKAGVSLQNVECSAYDRSARAALRLAVRAMGRSKQPPADTASEAATKPGAGWGLAVQQHWAPFECAEPMAVLVGIAALGPAQSGKQKAVDARCRRELFRSAPAPRGAHGQVLVSSRRER